MKLLLTILPLLLIGCTTKAPDPGPRDIQDEAKEQAALYVKSIYTKCGEYSVFAAYSDNFKIEQIVQAKNISFTVTELPGRPRAEAERLNEQRQRTGIEWRGEILIRCQVCREYLSSTGQWSYWEDDKAAQDVLTIKRDGVWTYDYGSDNHSPSYRPRAVDCSRPELRKQ